MTLRNLEIFTAVCNYKSITLAAEKLNFTQPAVSSAVKELETYYGIKLFDRISRRIYLTEPGKQLLIYAKQVVSLIDDMEKGVKDWESFGLLRVGSSITIGIFLISQYVKSFTELNPKMRVGVTIDNSSEIINKILLNELDLALIEGVSYSENIKSIAFMEDELVLVCSPDHSFAGKEYVTIEEAAGQPIIMREKGSGVRELFESTLLTNGIIISPAWESTSTEAIINAVSNGLGIAVLPYAIVKAQIKKRQLIRLNIDKVKLKRNFSIIFHKDKFLSKSIIGFIDLCRDSSSYAV